MAHSAFGPALDRTIKCSPRAPGEARRAVERLAGGIGDGLLRDVQLVVSELVTNSVRHSGSNEPIRLRAWARRGGLKVEIADGGWGFEPGSLNGTGGPDDEGGRGLLILEMLADRWGISHDAHTRVWFELAERPQSGRRARAS